MKKVILSLLVICLLTACKENKKDEKSSDHYAALSNIPFTKGFPSKDGIRSLQNELLFQRAVQTYIWALPALNIYSMKEASEKQFGAGYNIVPIWKQRLNAKTLITTPNSDVIYGMGYIDLKKDAPLVLDVPPGMQGILDDFFQRPVASEIPIEGRIWAGDIGLPGPDKGKGGKYLLLPPDYKGTLPTGYYPYRSRTYNVFVFLRGFFKDPKQLEEPVKVMEQLKIYPLGKEASAKTMQFPNGSNVPINMLYPQDGKAFEMLSRFINSEYADPADMEMRGMAAAIGILKNKPFNPNAETKELLDKAAKTAFRMGHAISYSPQTIVPNGAWYDDRKWLNVFPGNPTFTSTDFNFIDPRTGFFTFAYSASPAMAVNMENVGAKYPVTFVDKEGNFLDGDHLYKVNLPKGIPAALFWSVTLYDPITASGLDNGQPFPSINAMDKPVTNQDGSIDIYAGPESPGSGKNWIKTIPNKGFFVILRIYGPTKAFFDKTWKPSDVEKIK
ncbi:DUF1254 domain-containing protein [Flavobacterium artemisiae]|uniref:DUF1254 domain-containing protein n=1 Tax=Flavobacterium artemisiae TaxID=2126556 RepID=A0ABW4HIH7_9FLAO